MTSPPNQRGTAGDRGPTGSGRPWRSGASPEHPGVSVNDFGSTVLAARVMIARLVMVVCTLVLLATLWPERSYTSVASIMPQSLRGSSTLMGLAAQFGVAVPSGEMGGNLYLYAQLLRSRQILGVVVNSRFPLAGPPAGEGTLISYFRTSTPDSARATELAVRKLGSQIDVAVNRDAGVAELRVTTRDPQLSAAVASRLLMLLDSFNVATRRSRAGEERRFTEQRVRDARQELYEAEERLQSFLEKNRDYRNSPLLAFRQERLAREISLRQQVLAGLAQAYEQARIEEVKDIPVISVVEAPQAPGLPDSRHALVKLVLALVGSLSGGVFLAIGRGLPKSATSDAVQDAGRLRSEWENTLRDLARPWRLVWPAARARDPRAVG
jgi:uncharacterized protein involved in exopolysaccharide biosynthesis